MDMHLYMYIQNIYVQFIHAYICTYMYVYRSATVSSGSLKVKTFAQVSVKWEKQGDQSTLLRFHI